MRLGRCTRNAISSLPVQPDVADVDLRGRTNFLHEPELLLEPIEPIARPRERHETRQLR